MLSLLIRQKAYHFITTGSQRFKELIKHALQHISNSQCRVMTVFITCPNTCLIMEPEKEQNSIYIKKSNNETNNNNKTIPPPPLPPPPPPPTKTKTHTHIRLSPRDDHEKVLLFDGCLRRVFSFTAAYL